MALSSANSRRATCSRCTRSVVRANSTRRCEAEGGREMALAAAGWAEQQDIGALGQPHIARRERHYLGLRDHRHAVEVECGECLAGRQTCLGEVPLDTAAAAISHLVLGEHREEAGR